MTKEEKIKEVMELVDEIEYLAFKTRPVDHLKQAIESKLRELIQ